MFNKTLRIFSLTVLVFSSYFTGNLSVSAQQNTNYNTNYSTISYLGGSNDDTVSGVEIQNDGTIVLAANTSGNDFRQNALSLDGGGNGAVIRLDPSGKSIKSLTRISNYIDDIDIDPSNQNIILNTEKGVYKLSADGSKIIWKDSFGSGGSKLDTNGRKIAVAKDGTVAALINREVRIYNQNGVVQKTFKISNNRVNDIAIDSTNKTIFVVGDSQKDGGKCKQLRMAFIKAFDYDAKLKWTGYDWTKDQAAGVNSCADTALSRVSMGKDDQLYITGISAGGDTIYRKATRSLSENAPIVSYDKFNQNYNTASNNMGFYARLSPIDGRISKAQYVLARLSSSKGNTIIPKDIKGGKDGSVYLALESAAYFPNRADVKVNNQPIGGYYQGDVFFMQINPDMTKRQKIMSVTKSGGRNKTGYIAAGNDNIVIASKLDTLGKGEVFTQNPIQAKSNGKNEIFYGVTSVK